MSRDACSLYRLVDWEPVVERDVLVWARWFENADRQIALTKLSGGITVSTIFLGIDFGHGFTEEPLLFETYVSGGFYDGRIRRYATLVEARVGHALAVKGIFSGE